MVPDTLAAPPQGCRGPSGPDRVAVRWISPAAPRDRDTLDDWCRSIGPVVVASAPPNSLPPPHTSDSLTVVSWNVNVGAGNLIELVERLRRGQLTAPAQVGEFVILLQETYRVGPEVPRRSAFGFRIPKRLGDADPADDIRQLAWWLGLHLVYAPAMRNGDEDGDGASDRGNAILSTLPLDEVTVIELPFERQRRIAVAATAHAVVRNAATGNAATGNAQIGNAPTGNVAIGNVEPGHAMASPNVRLISTHFETRAGLTRGGPTPARHRQARGLIEALASDDAAPLIIGGDFNTSYGNDEPAIHELRKAFPWSTPTAWVTWRGPLGISARLDHIFARGVEESVAVRRVPDRFGSDHHPLITMLEWAER